MKVRDYVFSIIFSVIIAAVVVVVVTFFLTTPVKNQAEVENFVRCALLKNEHQASCQHNPKLNQVVTVDSNTNSNIHAYCSLYFPICAEEMMTTVDLNVIRDLIEGRVGETNPNESKIWKARITPYGVYAAIKKITIHEGITIIVITADKIILNGVEITIQELPEGIKIPDWKEFLVFEF